MKRLLLVLATLALVASACSGSAVDETIDASVAGDDTPAATTSSSSPAADSSDAPTATSTTDGTSSTADGNPPPEGPAARDFTLALEPSGEFVLSQEVKPVYMIFWAEW
jgi:hypothetical protein